MRFHTNNSERGSVSIEAAVIMPAFLGVLLVFVSLIQIISAENILRISALKTADKMCKWAPIYKNLAADNLQNEIVKKIGGELSEALSGEEGELISEILQLRKVTEYSFNYIYGFTSQKICESYINNDKLVRNKVVDISNLNLYKSTFFSNDTNNISLKAVCDVKTYLPFKAKIAVDIDCASWGKGIMPHVSVDIPDEKVSDSIWQKDNLTRGRIIRQMYGSNLPENFPVIASFEYGTATMIKSLNHTAKTYQDSFTFEKSIKEMIDAVANFEGSSMGGITVNKKDILIKKIILVLPENDFSFLQQNTLEYLMRYSATKLVVLDLQRYQKV